MIRKIIEVENTYEKTPAADWEFHDKSVMMKIEIKQF
jgi:hypothetical protein